MKRNLFLSGMIALCSCASAQDCATSSHAIAIYYSYSPSAKLGLGIEAGFLQNDQPAGLMIGCDLQIQKQNPAEKEEAPAASHSEHWNSTIYIKGLYRLLRLENTLSLFAVAAPKYSTQTGFQFQAGTEIFFPLSERVALATEPLYDFRQKNIQVRFHLVVLL